MATTLTTLNYATACWLDARPVMVVFQQDSQTFDSATPALLQWQSVYRDTGRGFNLGTATYTVTVPGWYRISAKIHWTGQTGGARYVQLRQNGSPSTVGIANRSPSSALTTAYMETLVQCEVGDTLQLWGNQNSGASVNTFIASGYNSTWSLLWISQS